MSIHILCLEARRCIFYPADILALLLDCSADLFTGALFALCQIQIIFSDIPAEKRYVVVHRLHQESTFRFSAVSVSAASGLFLPPEVGSSGALDAMIISLI